ncbi:MAG: hypothetical protein J6F33_09480, partial [Acidaminococcaceae bacterium]|nr:hypothetical protein [Acidaminococcaceae bacterium]
DDLNMGAVSVGYSPEEIGIIAIQAGSDILLSCHDPQIQQRTYKSVVRAVKDGKISQSEINASVQRILYCKLKNLMSTQQRKAVYEQIKTNSVTSK